MPKAKRKTKGCEPDLDTRPSKIKMATSNTNRNSNPNPNSNSITDEYIRDLLECPVCMETITSVPV